MAKAVIVEGLTETQRALERVDLSIQRFRVNVTDIVSKKTRDVAKSELKPRAGVETGALKDSIYAQIVQNNESVTEAIVQAGDPTVERGVGKYTIIKYGPRAGQKASIAKTSEYAHLIEVKYNYMRKAYNFAVVDLKKQFLNVIGKAIRGI